MPFINRNRAGLQAVRCRAGDRTAAIADRQALEGTITCKKN